MMPARLLSPPPPFRIGAERLSVVGPVRMYVCGITPYDVTHLGHASTYIWADVADRILNWVGYRVTVARNITDVDDVLYAEAARRQQDAPIWGAVQRASFESTMTSLRVRTPDVQPTAAQAIAHVIQLAVALLARDAAYVRSGTVYARTSGAAEASGLDRDTALRLATEYHDTPEDPAKEDPLDVAVWRSASSIDHPHIAWPSPWGPGRPGWHAECAAMILALYGPTVDIHCGGADLAFPHHACETAMAQAATGVGPFARSWLRAGLVQVNGAKMAKSTRNLVLVDDLLADYAPAVIRMLCLDRARDQPWSFDSAAIDAAQATLDELYVAAGRTDPADVSPELAEALLDDFDVPRAIRLASDKGGATARTLIDVLALT